MSLIKRLQDMSDDIERLEEEIGELRWELIGAEVTYKGKEAIVDTIDWRANHVLLNYDDENYEWVSFAEGADNDE
ncbi:hypothetical protein [Bacillus phage SBSphiJ2]|nr:hypothetical protein [Bacillus phage SBSphiJ1]UPI12176.1 hypothetical protein [Bacillus phage SBSphiJ2]